MQKRNERRRLVRLRGFVHEHGVEPVRDVPEHAPAAGGERGKHDFGVVHQRCLQRRANRAQSPLASPRIGRRRRRRVPPVVFGARVLVRPETREAKREARHLRDGFVPVVAHAEHLRDARVLRARVLARRLDVRHAVRTPGAVARVRRRRRDVVAFQPLHERSRFFLERVLFPVRAVPRLGAHLDDRVHQSRGGHGGDGVAGNQRVRGADADHARAVLAAVAVAKRATDDALE